MTTERNYVLWAHIEADPNQPRKHFDKDKLQELADSFGGKAEGIHTDLLVRAHPAKAGRFILVAGERRWRAADLAEIERVPVRVVSEAEAKNALQLQLTENMQRENMTALEEAAGAQKLLEECRTTDAKFSVEQLGAKLGLKRAATYELLSLLKLSKPVHDALVKGEINPSMAARIAAVPIPEAQADILQWVRDTSEYQPVPSVRDLQEYIEGNHCKSLAGASFKLDKLFSADVKQIVPFACVDCPHRSGNQPNWPEGKNQDTCLRPSCYRAKALQQAVDDGKEAINPKLFDQKRGDYVTPKQYINTHSHGQIPAKKAINTKAPPKAYVTTDSVGDLVELWLMKDWKASAESDGVVVNKPKVAPVPKPEKQKPASAAINAEIKLEQKKQRKADEQAAARARAAEKKEQEEREAAAAAEQLREKVVAAVLPELRLKLAKAPEKAVLIWNLSDQAVKREADRILQERKLKSLEKCDVGQLRSILCEVTWRLGVGTHLTNGRDYEAEFVTACKLAGIDLKAEEKKLAPKPVAEELPLGLAKATGKKKGSKKK